MSDLLFMLLSLIIFLAGIRLLYLSWFRPKKYQHMSNDLKSQYKKTAYPSWLIRIAFFNGSPGPNLWLGRIGSIVLLLISLLFLFSSVIGEFTVHH